MTQEELQELETLREEKRTRIQRERAEAALKEAGVPADFAPLLAGADDQDTDQRYSAFCAALCPATGLSMISTRSRAISLSAPLSFVILLTIIRCVIPVVNKTGESVRLHRLPFFVKFP